MHGPTQTTVESGGSGKNFGQRTVKQEITSQLLHAAGALLFHRLKTITIQKRLHYRLQIVILHLANGGSSLGQNLSMRTVRTKHVIIRIQ